MPIQDPLKEELLHSDAEFKKLHDEHQEYERRLQVIYHKTLPSQEDEVAEKQIKLHKLALKDRMEQIARHHRESRVSA